MALEHPRLAPRIAQQLVGQPHPDNAAVLLIKRVEPLARGRLAGHRALDEFEPDLRRRIVREVADVDPLQLARIVAQQQMLRGLLGAHRAQVQGDV